MNLIKIAQIDALMAIRNDTKNHLENMELETDVTDEMGYIYSGCNGLVFFELLICTRYIEFI